MQKQIFLMKINTSLVILLLLFPISIIKSQTYSKADIIIYISKYKQAAIDKMHQYKIPASITLSQGILESGAGSSYLATNGNNHFGIKCGSDWNGDTILKDDDAKNDCFRKYNSVEDCYNDHSKFLTEKSRYANLFTFDLNDYKKWANGLQESGYATSNSYATKLIKIIEDYELFNYDKIENINNPNNIIEEEDVPYDVSKTNTYIIADKELKPYQKIGSRTIFLNNHTRFLIARKTDTFTNIGKDISSEEWLLVRYNDVKKGTKVKEGDIVYIETKRKKTFAKTHIVKQGDTPHSISQIYAIKLKYLLKYNDIDENEILEPGTEILLRKK